MQRDPEELARHLHNASENVNTELKPWHAPTTDGCRAEIAKACIALRNNNGGFLIFGIRDDGKPDTRELFPDVRATFHIDIVQEIVSKFSSERFSVYVHYVERDGRERVMIEVPSGVTVPVMARTDLPAKQVPDGHKPGSLLKKYAIYVRTTNSGKVGTAPATPEDLPHLMNVCFENREADIGAFVRRQLSGIDISSTASSLFDVLKAAHAPEPMEIAVEFLNECYEKYRQCRDAHPSPIPDCGTREAAAVISGSFTHPVLNQDFMMRLNTQTQRMSGWPPFAALLNFISSHSTATYVSDGWESFDYSTKMWVMLEFARIQSSGQFYYLEGLRDDLTPQRLQPHTQLEFVAETLQVTRTIATTLSFARMFCGDQTDNMITFVFRWRGLAGRHLTSWAHSDRSFYSDKPSTEDEVMTHTTMPISTANNALLPHVERIVKPLFLRFGGMEFVPQVLAQIVDDCVNNRW